MKNLREQNRWYLVDQIYAPQSKKQLYALVWFEICSLESASYIGLAGHSRNISRHIIETKLYKLEELE